MKLLNGLQPRTKCSGHLGVCDTPAPLPKLKQRIFLTKKRRFINFEQDEVFDEVSQGIMTSVVAHRESFVPKIVHPAWQALDKATKTLQES